MQEKEKCKYHTGMTCGHSDCKELDEACLILDKHGEVKRCPYNPPE